MLVAVAAAVSSYWWDTTQICRVSAGGTPFIGLATCNPWGATDLLPPVLLALMLLLPDVSELSVANLVTLKRELKAQKAELRATNAKQEALEAAVAVQNAQSITHTTNFYAAVPASRLPDQIEGKRGFVTQEPVRQLLSTPPQDYAANVTTLIFEWERLRDGLDPGLVRPEVVRHFARVFDDEIQTVRAVRNSVAHGRPVSQEDLVGAIEAARKLNAILEESLAPGDSSNGDRS
ncbi:hypothetical protein GCM10022247_53200 [Allokutzneria multivorans]|uniref:Swt1-like HEPN domain-containing protein n=1 Tax=Allokutzneria multivorans TaxID=1142134 RepID=A0ABP7T7T6_9PSEU